MYCRLRNGKSISSVFKVKHSMIENIAKNLIFFDGITRCGKSIFSSIISSFEGVEHIQFFSEIEHIIPSVALGGIKKDYGRIILRLSLNELAYSIQLSRNVNFRPKDQTGIYNYKNPDVYYDRLKLDDGDHIVQFIRDHNISIPFQTHDLMANLDIVESMDMDYKIIELYRNPIDNIYSWYTQGWGERFEGDPRSFTLSVEYNNQIFPWFCVGYESKIVDLNPYEKCVMMGINLIDRCVSQQKNAKYPKKIMTILFEDMIQNPNDQLKRIESFLGKKKTKYTSNFVMKERCPRVLNYDDREKKLQMFKDNINTELSNSLVLLSESYEKDVYGLL